MAEEVVAPTPEEEQKARDVATQAKNDELADKYEWLAKKLRAGDTSHPWFQDSARTVQDFAFEDLEDDKTSKDSDF